MGPLALEVLDRLRPLSGRGEWVFPSLRLAGTQAVSQIQKFMVRLRRESGVDFVARDLRRTVATGLARLGVQQLTISKLLNHTVLGITDKHYDRHTYSPEKEQAILLWDEHIRALTRAPVAALEASPLSL